MHAWICDKPTGPEALSWQELPTLQPKAGEVRVDAAQWLKALRSPPEGR